MTDEASLRCRRGPRCADARRETIQLDAHTAGTVHVAAWATTAGGLCRMDTNHALRAVEQLPADYAELSELLGKTSRNTDAPIGGTRELPVPIRLNVEALQAAIVFELDLWAAPVAEASGFGYFETARPRDRVRSASGWITGRWPSLLSLPAMAVVRVDGREETLSGRNPLVHSEEDGVTGAITLIGLHDQVTELAGRTQHTRRLWTPCPACERLGLEHPEGSSKVDCVRCGHRMPLEEYERLSEILAHAYGAEAVA
jgi:hypothetical protein